MQKNMRIKHTNSLEIGICKLRLLTKRTFWKFGVVGIVKLVIRIYALKSYSNCR